jgi:hypothetical protein
MGKGDCFRPVDKKKYDSEFDRIFGDKKKKKKPTEGSWDANGSPVEDVAERSNN